MKWPSSSAPAARNSARTSSSVIAFPGSDRRPTDREQPRRASSVQQRRATCLRDADRPAYKAGAERPTGVRIQPPPRRVHRGLDEDNFQARRHRRRLRPGARSRFGRRGARAGPGRAGAAPPAPAPAAATPAASADAATPRRPRPRRPRPRRRAPRRRPASASPTAGSACRSRSPRSAQEAAWFHNCDPDAADHRDLAVRAGPAAAG